MSKRVNLTCAYCNKIVWFFQKQYCASLCGQCYQVSHYKCVEEAEDLTQEDIEERTSNNPNQHIKENNK